MSGRRGRPNAAGKYITLQLNQVCIGIMDAGAARAVAGSEKLPNRSAWFRALIEHVFGSMPLADVAAGLCAGRVGAGVSAEVLARDWPQSWFEQPTPHHVTMKLDDCHRLLLRQFECHVQSLDWLRDMYRNEVAQLLIAVHGPAFNDTYELLVSVEGT